MNKISTMHVGGSLLSLLVVVFFASTISSCQNDTDCSGLGGCGCGEGTDLTQYWDEAYEMLGTYTGHFAAVGDKEENVDLCPRAGEQFVLELEKVDENWVCWGDEDVYGPTVQVECDQQASSGGLEIVGSLTAGVDNYSDMEGKLSLEPCPNEVLIEWWVWSDIEDGSHISVDTVEIINEENRLRWEREVDGDMIETLEWCDLIIENHEL